MSQKHKLLQHRPQLTVATLSREERRDKMTRMLMQTVAMTGIGPTFDVRDVQMSNYLEVDVGR